MWQPSYGPASVSSLNALTGLLGCTGVELFLWSTVGALPGMGRYLLTSPQEMSEGKTKVVQGCEEQLSHTGSLIPPAPEGFNLQP